MTTLLIKWGESKGRETYGYTLCTITDTDTGKRYRTCGGGYDLEGTVLAEWLADIHQAKLLAHLQGQGMQPGDRASGGDQARQNGWTYGAGITSKGVAYMDGACGQSEVTRLAKALGLTFKPLHKYGRGGKITGTIGYTVSEVTQ